MAQRLNDTIRRTIVAKIMKDHFAEDDAALAHELTEFADALYEHQYGAAEALAKRMPPGWVESGKIITVMHPGFYANCWASSSDLPPRELEMSRHRARPWAGLTVTVDAAHPMYERAAKVSQKYVKLRQAREAMREELYRVVWAARTRKQLLALWPECEKYLPPEPTGTARAMVPVDTILALNARLGLGEPAAQ